MEIAIITALAGLSGFVTSFLGFGAGFLLTPLLAFVVDLRTAIGISTLVFFVTSGSKVVMYRRDIDMPVLRRALFFAVFGMAAGFFVVGWMPMEMLERIFAAVLLYFGVTTLMGASAVPGRVPPSILPVLGGLMSVLVHGGGVFFFRFCRALGLDRLETVGTQAAVHFVMNIGKAGFFLGVGIAPVGYVWKLVPAYAAAVLGTWAGRRVLAMKVSEAGFTRAVGVFLLVMAVRFAFG